MISYPTPYSHFFIFPEHRPAMAKEQAQLCKEDYTGWESRSACREYYYCDRGVADVIVSTELLIVVADVQKLTSLSLRWIVDRTYSLIRHSNYATLLIKSNVMMQASQLRINQHLHRQ